MTFLQVKFDILYKVWWALSAIFRSFRRNDSLASLPTIGALQIARTFRDNAHQSINVRFLEFIRGMSLLSQNGLLVLNFHFLRFVILNKSSAIKDLLNSKENVEKSNLYHFGKKILGKGLGGSGKAIWRDRRKKLAPSFHPKVTDAYLPVFVQCAKVLRDKLNKHAGNQINIFPLLSYCTMDIICETAMGVQLRIQDNEDSEILKSVHELGFSIVSRLSNILYWTDWSYKLTPAGRQHYRCLDYAWNFIMKVIVQRVAERTENKENTEREEPKRNTKFTSFLDKILDLYFNDDSFGLEDAQQEIATVIFGGYDTASLNMSFALFLLGQNPECQRKVHEELDDVFGSDDDTPMELEDCKRLTYLDCVIKEAARLYPPAPIIGRYLDEDLKIDDVVIPKGTDCLVIIDSIHRDPDVYADPEKFIPERWLPSDESPPPNPSAFLAFSGGPRGCPGVRFALQEMKVVLGTILKSFTVESTLPRDKLIMTFQAVQVPVGGVPVSFTHRKILNKAVPN